MIVDMKPLPADLIDALLADYKRPEDLIGQNGLLKQLTMALVVATDRKLTVGGCGQNLGLVMP